MEERAVLDSWKEISLYLHRSVMTCQRWEKRLDLPVHRLDGTPKARVFAYPDELDRWLAEKLRKVDDAGEIVDFPARPGRKRASIAVAIVSLLAAGAAVVWRLAVQIPVPAPSRVPLLAVLPFENRTAEPAWDDWIMALPDLITIDLRQSKFVDAVKTSDLFQAAGELAESEKFSPADLKKIAEKAGAGYLLTGSLARSGGDVIITAIIHRAETGEAAGSLRSLCRSEKDIFACVDRLSRGVKSALKVSARELRGDIDRPVSRITTKSPRAFVLYSQAYRIQGKRRFENAIAPLQKAVELDPDFGLAFKLLSYCCMTKARKEDQRTYGDIAMKLAGRIDERERAVLWITFFGSEQADISQEIRVYERLGKNYPYDLMMTGLAEIYIDREEWDKAIPILEKVASRHARKISVIQRLLNCHRSLGRFDKAERLLEGRSIGDSEPGRGERSLLLIRWEMALDQEKFGLAHELLDRSFPSPSDDPFYLSQKGYTYFLQDDLLKAESLYQKLAEKAEPITRMRGFEFLAAVSLSRGRIEEAKQRILRAIGLAADLKDAGRDMGGSYHYFLAYLERLSGRLPEALKEAELACGNGLKAGFPYLRPLYLRALITLEMGRFEEFDRQVEEIRLNLEPGRFRSGAPRLMRVYYDLLGHRALRKNNFDQAIGYFGKALDLLSVFAARNVDADHVKYFYDMAEAYRRSDAGDSLVFYEKALRPTVSREFSGDLYARCHYEMGLEWERRMRSVSDPNTVRERRSKAIGYFRKFLELWKDADPIFSEVEDAKLLLARLEAR